MRFWVIIAVIIAACFSGGILNKILSPEINMINTFEELIGSGLKVYTYNDSWIWWQFKAYNEGWNKQLDEKLSKIENRMEFITREKFKDQVSFEPF